jgi:hypothetical protein
VAWNRAVLINSAAGYGTFLAQYPDSDLTVTARKMIERLRYRPEFVAAVAATAAPVQNASLTCPCGPQPAPQLLPQQKKVDVTPVKPDPPKRAGKPKRPAGESDDVVVVRRPPPQVVYDPGPPPIGIGIGIGIGGGGGFGGPYGGGGNYGGGRRGY